jgi:predicted CoA-binding protein
MKQALQKDGDLCGTWYSLIKETLPMSQTTQTISALLTDYDTIAVVGLSAKSDRPSHQVARYMQAHGYRIIPVNPMYAGAYILEEPCYPSLSDAAEALAKDNIRIQIVDCFRKSEAVETIADDAIAIGAPVLWMQVGVINQKAAVKASAAGLTVVMDRCLKIEHVQALHRPG